jgi:hypothetical protein
MFAFDQKPTYKVHLTENCTGTVKLMELTVISGGNDGSGCARRIIAIVSASSPALPEERPSLLDNT